MKPKKISREKADALLASGVKDTPKGAFFFPGAYRPLGLFYLPNDDGGFTAFDNRRGYCWVEAFQTLDDCLLWLENEELEASEIWEKRESAT